MVFESIPLGATFKGKEFEELMKVATKEKIEDLTNCLSKYDGKDLFSRWQLFIRQIDEFINMYYELSPVEKLFFYKTHLDTYSIDNLALLLGCRFSEDAVERILILISQFMWTKLCLIFGHCTDIMTFTTVGELLDFCQKRRLHYVTILQLIPKFAKGTKRVQHNVVEDFWGCVEFCLMPITGSYHSMVQSKCISEFEAENVGIGLKFSHNYSQLEEGFLEPQRMTEIDLLELNPNIRVEKLEQKDQYKLYSARELEVIYTNDAIYYEKYNIATDATYKMLGNLISDVKPYFVDEYEIKITEDKFGLLKSKYKKLSLVCDSNDLYDIQNSRIAFYKFENVYYSNHFLLIRFYVNTLNNVLRHNRTYQIDSGFLFEKKVVSIVQKYGFVKQRNCTRINHKEFDVVCAKNGCIYNFQCKNNYFDAGTIDANRVEVISRYHKRLANYYEKALKKEENREELLKKKLGLNKIRHFVISRYPVISNNERVIPFNKLEEFLQRLCN